MNSTKESDLISLLKNISNINSAIYQIGLYIIFHMVSSPKRGCSGK